MEIQEVTVFDKMQKGYSYLLTEEEGKNFHPDFKPELTPQQMLTLGVFGGKYMTDCRDEFPQSWFENARLSTKGHLPELNYFAVNASQDLKTWQSKGWIYPEDPRGWFQWYCRYYRGRRCDDDARQIKRWRLIRRHAAQIRKNCAFRDLSCRPRQRQALMNWAYDSRMI
ncbi:hypothetical protein EXM22_17970 [Oceanispirochaeta crateris]|uniref:Uncharacterized protein n=1 Tax=Oceanispirochaeta crateris TaxID=2518645 RepID=A0A5C1QQZ4_9SPIO|nr:hypothetical protein [Oceanispirochaeta crateris]QEN09778.1 hypothetical protein EXM22_17970 [Oceanispirochaeta crateris]